MSRFQRRAARRAARAYNHHVRTNDPDRCGACKREYRADEGTVTGTTAKGRWLTACGDCTDKIVLVHAIGTPPGSTDGARKHTRATVNDTPAPWIDGDTEWFKRNTGSTSRHRRPYPGELEASAPPDLLAEIRASGDVPMIDVLQPAPGMRARVVVSVPPGDVDPKK